MNLFGLGDAYVADVLTSTFVCSLATLSGLILVGLITYVAQVVGLLHDHYARMTGGIVSAVASRRAPHRFRARLTGASGQLRRGDVKVR